MKAKIQNSEDCKNLSIDELAEQRSGDGSNSPRVSQTTKRQIFYCH